MNSGIYLLKNKINNKIYVGQSIDIKHRIGAYKSVMLSTKKLTRPIDRAIKKYGWSNFEFSIIESCGISELDTKEIYWISALEATNYLKGYNISEGGNKFRNAYLGPNNPFFGKHHSLEIRKLLSNAALARFKDKTNHPFTGRKHKPETILKLKKIKKDYAKRPVLQFDIKTYVLIKRWPSARDAARNLFDDPKKSNGICVACRQYKAPTARKTAFGFRWEYEKSPDV